MCTILSSVHACAFPSSAMMAVSFYSTSTRSHMPYFSLKTSPGPSHALKHHRDKNIILKHFKWQTVVHGTGALPLPVWFTPRGQSAGRLTCSTWSSSCWTAVASASSPEPPLPSAPAAWRSLPPLPAPSHLIQEGSGRSLRAHTITRTPEE